MEDRFRFMKRIVRRWIVFVIILFGLVLLNYPYLSGVITDAFAVQVGTKAVEEMAQDDDGKNAELLKRAEEYNAALAMGADLSEFADFELIQPGALLGYLEVPQIDVYMPVRYGTIPDVLDRNLGCVEETSLPVGGLNVHSSISGHTGMATKKMLTDLTAVQKGDVFFMHTLGRDLAYRVEQIDVVLPSEDELLAIVPGHDYMTLITCTPYGVNDHRLLVRGERIEYDFTKPAVEQQVSTEKRLSDVQRTRIYIAIGSGIVLIGLLVYTIIGTVKDERRRRQKQQQRAAKAAAAAKDKLRRKGEPITRK